MSDQPSEGRRAQMLQEMRALLTVLDRQLPRLRQIGPSPVLASTEDLRARTAALIAQLETDADA